MAVYTTEIASDQILSDNPIHQRLLKAYVLAEDYLGGDLLEVGCGEGRGVELLMKGSASYTAIDKIGEVVERLGTKYPDGKFIQANIPPFKEIEDDRYDLITSFQVIEHIKNDRLFLQEIYRVLKPGGTALITTPNIKKTLTRNPWHVREYTATQLTDLAKSIFDEVEMNGVGGNEKVMTYYEQNKASVARITRWDFLNLQYRLPAFLLRIPYDLLNRMNRNKLNDSDNDLVASITHQDYLFTENAETALDLFAVLKKKG